MKTKLSTSPIVIVQLASLGHVAGDVEGEQLIPDKLSVGVGEEESTDRGVELRRIRVRSIAERVMADASYAVAVIPFIESMADLVLCG